MSNNSNNTHITFTDGEEFAIANNTNINFETAKKIAFARLLPMTGISHDDKNNCARFALRDTIETNMSGKDVWKPQAILTYIETYINNL